MNNYPIGAKEDTSAPFNQVDTEIEISIFKDEIEVYYEGQNFYLDEYDIVNNFIPKEHLEKELSKMESSHNDVKITFKDGSNYVINECEFEEYISNKYF